MKYLVDPVKCAVNAAVCVVMLLFTVGAALFHQWSLFAVFLAACLGFLWFTMDYASTVEFRGDIVTQRLPVIGAARTYSRDEIKEAGVLGTNIYYRRQPNKSGTVYLYFSPRRLSEIDKFDLGLKWKRDIIRLRFSKDRYMAAQLFWDGKLQEYNIGDLEL